MKRFFRLRAAAALLLAAAPPVAPARGDSWTTYEPSTLEANRYFDGDSFHVRAPTRYTYIFRLYFADCPETDRMIPERVAEQAKYFGVSEEAVVRWGARAKQETADFLSRPFTVQTRKEKAMGHSDQTRYFALITRDGKDLAERLVSAGLARAFGQRVDLPDGTPADRAARRFRQLESEARSQRRGIWGEAGGAHASASPSPAAAAASPAPSATAWPWPSPR